MCDTHNQPLRNTSLLPTGHWGMVVFDSNMRHVKHIKHWKPSRGALMRYFRTNNRLLIYALCVILPTGQWGMPNYSQTAIEEQAAAWGEKSHQTLKTMSEGPDVLFRTNSPLLIYALCVILQTGQWGTPHYSQPATEEWLYLTAMWGTWNPLNVENHLAGLRWVIFDRIIQSRCLSYRGDSQLANEEHPITPKLTLRKGSCMGR